ncbi:Deoxybrevianamide E synthase, partial [Frankliniella fusca]
ERAQHTPAFLRAHRIVEQSDAHPQTLSSRQVCQICHQDHSSGVSNYQASLSSPSQLEMGDFSNLAAYQAGQIWGRSLQTDWKNLPSPVGWGWKGTPGSCLLCKLKCSTVLQVHHWSDLDGISQTCRKLSVCGCASDCSTMRCARRKAGVCCALSLKKCKGNCSNVSRNAVPESENEDVDGDLQEI